MFYIPVILGSIRRNRESAKVATFAINRLKAMEGVQTELIDLRAINLPLMEERLRFRHDPPESVIQFSSYMERASSIVIVTPEYNNGYPGVLKNALDYLKDEYRRKPFGIITVSSSAFGGMLCLTSLRQVILHLGGVPIPAILPVPHVQSSFGSEGVPSDPATYQRAERFFSELLWFTEALSAQRSKS
jgi:NAD(P)H-dependent FMN reductase